MAGSFPTLRSGNTVMYPLNENSSFGTGVHRFMDDSEQRWRARQMLRKFDLKLVSLHGYDASKVLNFFRSQFGMFDTTWSMTVAGVTYNNMAFAEDTYTITESKPNYVDLTFKIIQTKSDNPTIPSAANGYFPQLISQGITTSLPYTGKLEYRTVVDDLMIGKRTAYKWRTNPLGLFEVFMPTLSNAELVAVKNHFYAMEGRKGEFTFLDPAGNLVNYSDDFSQAAWTKSNVTVGAAASDPFGGSLATNLTSTVADGFIHTVVLPSGNASGFVLCASVWARALSAGQTLAIGFMTPASVSLARTNFELPQNQWVRISQAITLATASNVLVNIGGSSTWGTSRVIQLFSAQCTPMPGPGPRLLTPGADALRLRCRYDTDDLVTNYVGNNHASVTLPIREFV